MQELIGFHAERFAVLAESGADLLACETIPSLDEARAYAHLLQDHPNCSAWMSFTSRDGVLASHGESLEECARFLDAIENIVAIGVNCVEPGIVTQAIQAIRKGTSKPVVVYPNSGEHWDAGTREWTGAPHQSQLVDWTSGWLSAGAQWIGGCCRTRPADIAEMARQLQRGG